MLKSQKLMLESSELRVKLVALLEKGASRTVADNTELEKITARLQDVEREYQAAVVLEGVQEQPDAENREFARLCSKAKLGNYLVASIQRRTVVGAERELSQAANVAEGIPVALFGYQRPGGRYMAVDVATPSPGTGEGVTLRPIIPGIFSRSVLSRLGVAMPSVPSGGYTTMTVTTNQSAAAVAKGAKQESTLGALTAHATSPHRVAARLTIQVEDIAAIGAGNFEAILRQNTQLALSAELDRLGLLGDPSTTAAEPQGLFTQLADPTNPSGVVDFDGFVALAAGAIDGGPWAESLADVRLLFNADTMTKAETTFQTVGNSFKGELAAASYLRTHTGGIFSSARMPDTDTTIAPVIRYRGGTMGLDGVDAMETATCPMWDSLQIDDPYSDSGSGQRHFTITALIGDVLINHVDAYERVDLKIA